MKKLLIIIVLCVCAVVSGNAQDKNADVKKLLSLMNSEKLMQETMKNMMKVMQQQFASNIQGENVEQKKEKLTAVLVEESTKMMNDLMSKDMVDIYAKHFTASEIKDLINFYQSSTGKNYLEKTPAITGEFMTSMMQNYMPAMQKRLKATFEDLK